MMRQKSLFVMIISLMIILTVCGCNSNSPVIPSNNDWKTVGDYTYSQRSGEVVETGVLMMDQHNKIRLVPDDRSATTISNWWFDIELEYLDYRRLEDGLPVYSRNDNVVIDFTIEYKQDLPLNQPPLLYTRGCIQHRNARNGALLPGNSVQVGQLLFQPYGNLLVRSVYHIPPGVPQEYPYTNVAPIVNIELVYKGGIFTMNLISGGVGVWLLEWSD